jgi:hypothetical protein
LVYAGEHWLILCQNLQVYYDAAASWAQFKGRHLNPQITCLISVLSQWRLVTATRRASFRRAK